MRALRNWLRGWLAVPEPYVPPPPFEPRHKLGAEELAALDAAEIIVVYEYQLASKRTIATMCERYLDDHRRAFKFGYPPMDFSHNKAANAHIERILADCELSIAKQNFAKAKARAKEVR